MAKRFGSPVSDGKKPSITTTKASSEWGICVWNENEWASIWGSSGSTDRAPVDTPLLEMPVADLSYWMGKFVLEVRRKDGMEYLPKSLYALMCCFKRLFFFFEQNGVHNINPLSTTDNAVFGDFHRMLDAEMKRFA